MNKKAVIIDTDIGADVDDAFALSLALSSPELDIKAVLTNDRYSNIRAKIAKKLVSIKKKDIMIFEGLSDGNGKVVEKTVLEESFTPDKLINNLDFFRNLAGQEIYYISIGNLSNICYLINKLPEIKSSFKFIIMGGSINFDYSGKNNRIAEWNIKNNIPASKEVIDSGADITLVPLDATYNLELDEETLLKFEKSKNQICNYLYIMARNLQKFLFEKYNITKNIVFHDPLVLALAINNEFCTYEIKRLEVNEEGKLIDSEKGKKIKVAIKTDKEKFLAFILERLLNQKAFQSPYGWQRQSMRTAQTLLHHLKAH
ncbi:MAG: nucleoside hydrolase [Nanoarchaeota archaeon]|nr:nucleoside hydrolase [Nanoarchaeota archaeon]